MILRYAARLLVALGLILGTMSPRVALAQDDATVEMARQRFREGVGFFDQRQYEKARLAFLQAYALKPHPSILLNLAQSELRAGHPDDASVHFSEYLRTNTEASEAEKQEAELGFAASKSKVGEITLSVDVPGAQISVDGAEKGVAPLSGPLYLMPGTHAVEARSNEKRVSKSVSVTAGQAAAVSLALRGSAAAAAPAPGPASENEPLPEPKPTSEPEDESQPEPATPEPEATLSTSGRKPFFKWLVESPGGLALAIVGGVGLVGGTTFAFWSKNEYSKASDVQATILQYWHGGDEALIRSASSTSPELADKGPCTLPDSARDYFRAANRPNRPDEYRAACAQYSDYADSGDSKKTIAIAGVIVGGVGIAGTIVYYFVDSKPKDESASRPGFQARVAPWVTPETRGIGVVGRF